MSEPRWRFLERRRAAVRRDPFEAEFFTGDEDDEVVYGRTDALIRESIQNSLDARIDASAPVRMRFAVFDAADRLQQSQTVQYVRGLEPHVLAAGAESQLLGGSMAWLVVEDFNTHGLNGDPGRTADPAPGTGREEAFYWFWRNIGRSGKSGSDLGRWGLGKTVFPATSRVSAMWGLTVRSADRRALLMGQCVLKIHTVSNREYEPEGFFGVFDSDGVALPCEDADFLRAFSERFQLKRERETGLSVVVPFPPVPRLKATEILRSALVHYIVPILAGNLELEIGGPDLQTVVVSATNAEELCGRLHWNGTRKTKKHAPPPVAFIRRCLEARNSLVQLRHPGAGVPGWSDELFPEGELSRCRQLLADGRLVALRVQLSLQRKSAGLQDTWFEAFLQSRGENVRNEDYYVREGMTISGVSSLNGTQGLLGLVLVDHGPLSSLLGDAEGPAHTDWGTGESRPDRTFISWKRRVTFVKNSLVRLQELLEIPPEGLHEDLLADIFWVEQHLDPDLGPAPEPKEDLGPVVPTPDPPGAQPDLSISRIAGGFSLVPRNPSAVGKRFRVSLAYDTGTPSALRSWSRFDFVTDDEPGNPLIVTAAGVYVIERHDNSIRLEFRTGDGRLSVVGFEPHLDLLVDVRAEDDSQA